MAKPAEYGERLQGALNGYSRAVGVRAGDTKEAPGAPPRADSRARKWWRPLDRKGTRQVFGGGAGSGRPYGVALQAVPLAGHAAMAKPRPWNLDDDLVARVKLTIKRFPNYGYRRLALLRCVVGLLALRSDKGLVFGSRHYTATVKAYGLTQEFSMSYRPENNGLIECLFRSLKKESIWQQVFESLGLARAVSRRWIRYYNEQASSVSRLSGTEGTSHINRVGCEETKPSLDWNLCCSPDITIMAPIWGRAI